MITSDSVRASNLPLIHVLCYGQDIEYVAFFNLVYTGRVYICFPLRNIF